jgi:hypothetical protein
VIARPLQILDITSDRARNVELDEGSLLSR